jgi:hypothetical protein
MKNNIILLSIIFVLPFFMEAQTADKAPEKTEGDIIL